MFVPHCCWDLNNDPTRFLDLSRFILGIGSGAGSMGTVWGKTYQGLGINQIRGLYSSRVYGYLGHERIIFFGVMYYSIQIDIGHDNQSSTFKGSYNNIPIEHTLQTGSYYGVSARGPSLIYLIGGVHIKRIEIQSSTPAGLPYTLARPT